MATGPKYLVIDGYTKEGRDQLVSGGASTAAQLYCNMLLKCSPPGAECEVLFPSDAGANFPTDERLARYDGIAWTGCSLCLNDSHMPEVSKQVDLARRAFRAKVPSFGSCWAAQIAVVAAGGQVQPNPNGREMGIARKIQLTAEGRAHPMYEGKANVFDGFTSHDDAISHLPPGAVVLSRNAWTQVQSVAVTHQGGTFWGLQYHPEYDLHEMARLIFCRIPKLVRLGFFRDEADANQCVNELEKLHDDPGRKDIAWRLGIDADVMNEDIRLCEVRNWVQRLVLPKMVGRVNR
jgi:GMP synthase (glutamine-hydrolysing)